MMFSMRTCLILLSSLVAAAPVAVGENDAAASAEHAAAVTKWREQRVARLTSENGWLTLVGLFWLKPGENTFGRGHRNALVLDHPQLAQRAGAFTLIGSEVRFDAATGADIRLDGKPVESLTMNPDTSGTPTVLASGTLRFHVIERVGQLGVRVRDVAHPLRTRFAGLDYFPISDAWAVHAKFHPYEPVKRVPIVNVLGMVEDMQAPGYLTFIAAGREWRLDALLEEEGADSLFLMFADATSGRETYGAGRFMYVPLPVGGEVPLDFNLAYNPPCAFNEFATCPLPPRQNRLTLRIDAGERTYHGAHANN
jgi:uncharacterized protein (DUF1684 family)